MHTIGGIFFIIDSHSRRLPMCEGQQKATHSHISTMSGLYLIESHSSRSQL